MNIIITLDYNTSWGEKLFLRNGKKKCEMRYIYAGAWQIDIESINSNIYSFEVWKNNECIRKEWRGHVLPTINSKVLKIRTKWQDRPSDLPFYSSMFKDVVFRRKASVSAKKTTEGNVLISFLNPKIRSDQTIAITGSGDKFGNWTKFIALDDSDFPVWKATLNINEPIEYKFVILDKKSKAPLYWEEGINHFLAEVPQKNCVLSIEDLNPVFGTEAWKGAGVAVPVFSLKSEKSFGIGEFYDLKKLVDWAEITGQNIIQLLPINDTTMTRTWQDSYPYNANSSFALHPQFINLSAAGVPEDKAFRSLQDELNALPEVDYERVNNEKDRLLRKAFKKKGKELLSTESFKDFYANNEEWLLPYAAFCCLRDENGTADFSKWGKYSKYVKKNIHEYISEHKLEAEFYYYVQYCLDSQLKEVVMYAHNHGVALKGDLPIGVSRTSADAWTHPQLFNLNSQAGAPPDAFSAFGQNWGFPTYNWEKMSEDGFGWWKSRMKKMSEYFDCFRIDHILGFFRIWEIPYDNIHGLLGYFNPALPYSGDELRNKGFEMYGSHYSTPLLDEWVIRSIFGDLAEKVRSKYIKDGRLVASVATQRKVEALFNNDKGDNKKLRDGFMTLLDDVLFIEDPRKKGHYHPRIAAHSTYAYMALNDNQKEAFNALYTDFFYHRHNQFWKDSALWKLPSLVESTDMLACGEDLGMIPDCVPEVMRKLGILSLEIQRMAKNPAEEFANPAQYPYMCVCTTGTHDTSPLRAWWEEDRAASERFYRRMLDGAGEMPYFCEPWLCERIVQIHLDSPAMLAILPLQDWLSIDGDVRYQGNPSDERINVPAIPRYYWKYRMHLTIEQLLDSSGLNSLLKNMIATAHRG